MSLRSKETQRYAGDVLAGRASFVDGAKGDGCQASTTWHAFSNWDLLYIETYSVTTRQRTLARVAHFEAGHVLLLQREREEHLFLPPRHHEHAHLSSVEPVACCAF